MSVVLIRCEQCGEPNFDPRTGICRDVKPEQGFGFCRTLASGPMFDPDHPPLSEISLQEPEGGGR